MDSRQFSILDHQFGFQGMEKETKQPETQYHTLFRQYDAVLGRWWSIDPEQGRYAAFSPFLAMVANPVNIVDPWGNEFINSNMTEDEMNVKNEIEDFWLSTNSPYITSIIMDAHFSEAKIYLNSFYKPAESETPSHIGRSQNIEAEWNISPGLGLTLRSFFNIDADVVLDKNNLKGTGIGEDFNQFFPIVSGYIDELHHALSKSIRDIDKEYNDHLRLYKNVKKEYDDGVFDSNPEVKNFIGTSFLPNMKVQLEK